MRSWWWWSSGSYYQWQYSSPFYRHRCALLPPSGKRAAHGELLLHFLASFWRVIASLALSILLAAPAGLVLGQSPALNRLFAPFVYLVYPIPKVVLVPLVLLFLGVGDLAKIMIIFLILFFQILVLVRDQAAALRPELIQIGTQPGSRAQGVVPFCVFTCQCARHPDWRAPVHRDGDRGALYRRVVCHPMGIGILHLL